MKMRVVVVLAMLLAGGFPLAPAPAHAQSVTQGLTRAELPLEATDPDVVEVDFTFTWRCASARSHRPSAPRRSLSC